MKKIFTPVLSITIFCSSIIAVLAQQSVLNEAVANPRTNGYLEWLVGDLIFILVCVVIIFVLSIVLFRYRVLAFILRPNLERERMKINQISQPGLGNIVNIPSKQTPYDQQKRVINEFDGMFDQQPQDDRAL